MELFVLEYQIFLKNLLLTLLTWSVTIRVNTSSYILHKRVIANNLAMTLYKHYDNHLNTGAIVTILH